MYRFWYKGTVFLYNKVLLSEYFCLGIFLIIPLQIVVHQARIFAFILGGYIYNRMFLLRRYIPFFKLYLNNPLG
jgi:hypothetical protein